MARNASPYMLGVAPSCFIPVPRTLYEQKLRSRPRRGKPRVRDDQFGYFSSCNSDRIGHRVISHRATPAQGRQTDMTYTARMNAIEAIRLDVTRARTGFALRSDSMTVEAYEADLDEARRRHDAPMGSSFLRPARF